MSQKRSAPLIHYLRSFKSLDQQQVLLIEANCESVRINRGEWLLSEGDTCNYIYFLNYGMIRTVADQDAEVTAWVTLPHHFITSTHSYLKKRPSMVGLQAIAKSELIRISRDAAKELYYHIPVLKDISLAIMNEYYIDLERLYIFCLAHSARQRYEHLHAHFPDHFFKVPLKYLASMIHVKPETLSRIRRLQQNNDDELLAGTG